eukprot:scaffold23073_cov97-Isochrysis_galbana.AAC.2
MTRARNNSSPLAEGNAPHLSTRTKQGYPPSPHLTKRLNSSSPIHSTTISPNMTSHNTQSTDHNKTPQLKPNAFVNDTPNGSRKRDELKKNTGANAPWGHSGNVGTLKRGPPLRVRGDIGASPRARLPPPLS